MLGIYENFPQTLHRVKTYNSPLSRRILQQRITQAFEETNIQTFTFEEIGTPSVPDSTLTFEFGIADENTFNFLTKEEAEKIQISLLDEPMRVMDWFCAIKYYRNGAGKRSALKFDYYMVRMIFSEKGSAEFQVFHERGPRYVSPEELLEFIVKDINAKSRKRILKPKVGDD